MKTSLEDTNIRLEQEEERISELEDRTIEIIQSEKQKEKRIKKTSPKSRRGGKTF